MEFNVETVADVFPASGPVSAPAAPAATAAPPAAENLPVTFHSPAEAEAALPDIEQLLDEQPSILDRYACGQDVAALSQGLLVRAQAYRSFVLAEVKVMPQMSPESIERSNQLANRAMELGARIRELPVCPGGGSQ